ncbi:hypothetical protein GGU11DRAFT_781981 [Lentinula aff. detonsa]|uniref:Uncharacterized protein n=1 Tax=Lentinula aff. detonsa TaxID=2804958 RepID=A0AA38L483_9AGAR|nr:hypothetical protein GGU10DRAFT_389388 [Lentinula aff. detonsa]KAJ3798176.1 hypothetical protein GGU11DRAFT_781981 [Lentinula aff. detonsa]
MMDGLKSQQDKFKQRIAAITLEEDPLAVYVEFVQWTLDNFDDDDPHSELDQLLDEATRTFKNDESYKADLRYLKLWTLYANRVSQRSAIGIYSQLWKNGFGVSYSLLYEEYARMLETVGRIEDADQIYRIGIKRKARPAERLKARYTDFQERHGKKPSLSQDTLKSKIEAASTSPRQPSTAASRYATMLAPPPPGKRPEKLCFDMSLLYTEKTGEFCIEEARTRSMGLLRREWPILPIESLAHSTRSSLSTLSRAGESFGRFGKRKSMLAGEPTVTINTREALEDVFGMYNSPDRTIRMGSKHAPVKKIEPVPMPKLTPSPPTAFQDGIHKSAGFRPFVDEDPSGIGQRKENTPAFTPFVDSENKPSASTSRPAFAAKAILPHQNLNPLKDPKKVTSRNDSLVDSIFSQKVFIPETKPQTLPLREAHTEDHGRLRLKQVSTHERAKSDHDIAKSSHSVAFKPFVDPNNMAPFRVFSRPSEGGGESIFAPKLSTQKSPILPGERSTFVPYKDHPENSTQGGPLTSKKSQNDLNFEQCDASQSYNQGIGPLQEEERVLDQYPDEDENDYSDDFETVQRDFDAPLQEEHEENHDGQEIDYHDVPFGGRFGQFSVMTPITERTFEYTSTSHSTFNTPSNLLKHDPILEEEHHSQQLEAAQLVPDGEEDFEHEDEDEVRDVHNIQPLRLPSKEASVSSLTQSTSKLSLVDTLTLSSNFRPSNPCNPFDPHILRTLLSRLNPHSQCFDLTDVDRNELEELQKFTKRNRKTSSSLSGEGVYPLTLNGQRFVVSEKLGEGGFGTVFKARDLGAQSEYDSDFEDEDEIEGEEASMVALKVVRPRNMWEYHVLRRLHSALPPANRRSIVFPHALYAFRNESYLVLDYCPQGTLLDIVNTAESASVSQQGACLDELLVMFFTIELLRLLEVMHTIGFIHGDLKIDNCLLRLEDIPEGSSSWSNAYRPSGEGGWSYKGLKVIDFGRTIDTRLFPADQQFIADWETDERDCMEIQQGKPWTFQTDYFGLAGIIYCMFFGKYIQSNSIGSSTSHDGITKLKLMTPLKRYWQTDLWARLFDLLLNPTDVRPDGHMPISDELGSIRTEMEEWLQANCNRTTGTLKGLLKKVEMSCLR